MTTRVRLKQLRPLPRYYAGTRRVVGASGFEPAPPCAQGSRRGHAEALKRQQIARFSKSCNHFCDHLSRDAPRRADIDGEYRAVRVSTAGPAWWDNAFVGRAHEPIRAIVNV